MKICFLAHASSIHTRRWVNFFHSQGHQVSVISFTPTTLLPNIDLHILQPSLPLSHQFANWHYLLKIPSLHRIIRKIQPDIINAHFLSSYGFLGALTKTAGVPYVVSLHGSDILVFPHRSLLHRWITQFTLKRTDLVTSVSQQITHELQSYNVNGMILTLQYGVDIEKFYPSSVVQRSPICISNRAFVPASNLDTILFAAAKLKRNVPHLRFLFAGDGTIATQIQDQAQKLNLGDTISFLGNISHSQMPELLRKSAIYVSMTNSDGASLSLLEAMACGAFPVVSDIPANREWIENGKNGYLVPLNDPMELAKSIIDAWERPNLREMAAQFNWSIIREKGNYHKNMSKIETTFKHLLT